MRIDFPQGVPDGCILWLREHVGMGMNVGPNDDVTFGECAWFYERRFEPDDLWQYTNHPEEGSYIPSITIRDGNSPQAIMFALRWSGS